MDELCSIVKHNRGKNRTLLFSFRHRERKENVDGIIYKTMVRYVQILMINRNVIKKIVACPIESCFLKAEL